MGNVRYNDILCASYQLDEGFGLHVGLPAFSDFVFFNKIIQVNRLPPAFIPFLLSTHCHEEPFVPGLYWG
jgi:hypothetical protein